MFTSHQKINRMKKRVTEKPLGPTLFQFVRAIIMLLGLSATAQWLLNIMTPIATMDSVMFRVGKTLLLFMRAGILHWAFARMEALCIAGVTILSHMGGRI